MVQGWYTGASGMIAQQNRLDAISNNLANVDTTGYKRDTVFPLWVMFWGGSADVAPIVGKVGLGVETNELYTVFEQGSFKNTGAATDIALAGEGFFAVQTPAGERYDKTKTGTFRGLDFFENMTDAKRGKLVTGVQ